MKRLFVAVFAFLLLNCTKKNDAQLPIENQKKIKNPFGREELNAFLSTLNKTSPERRSIAIERYFRENFRDTGIYTLKSRSGNARDEFDPLNPDSDPMYQYTIPLNGTAEIGVVHEDGFGTYPTYWKEVVWTGIEQIASMWSVKSKERVHARQAHLEVEFTDAEHIASYIEGIVIGVDYNQDGSTIDRTNWYIHPRIEGTLIRMGYASHHVLVRLLTNSQLWPSGIVYL